MNFGGRGAPAGSQLGRIDREIAGIQPDYIGGLVYIQIDLDFAAEAVLLRNDGEVQTVAYRLNVAREAELGRLAENPAGKQKEEAADFLH